MPHKNDRLNAPKVYGENGHNMEVLTPARDCALLEQNHRSHTLAEAALPPVISSVPPFPLEQLFAASGDAVLAIDPDRKIRYASHTIEAFCGRAAADVVGLSIQELYPPDITAFRESPLDALFCRAQREQTLIVEEHPCLLTGTWYEHRAQPLLLADGNSGALIILRNIDDRFTMQQRYERIIATAQGGFYEVDHKEDRAYFSPQWKSMTACGDLPENADAAARFDYWYNRVHPEDRQALADHYHAWNREGKPFGSVTFRLRFVDDTGEEFYRWFLERGYVERDAEGNPVRTTKVLNDVTAQKEGEVLLAEEKRRFERAMEAARDGLWETDFTVPTADGEGATYRSPAWKYLVGVSDQQPTPDDPDFRKAFFASLHPDDRVKVEQIRNDCLYHGKPFARTEFRVRQHDGSYRWMVMRGKTYRDESGKLLRLTGIVTDIHDRKQAEVAMVEANARFERAIQASRDAIWDARILFEDGKIKSRLHRPLQFWQLFGFDSIPEGIDPETGRLPEFDGDDIWQYRIHPDDYDRVREYRANVFDSVTGTTETEYRILHNSGQYRWIVSRSRVERDENGLPAYLTGVLTDIHERKEAESRVRQLETDHRLLLEAVSDGVFRLGPDGKVVFLSDSLAQEAKQIAQWAGRSLPVSGSDSSEQSTDEGLQAWLNVIHPDEREATIATWAGHFARGQGGTIRCRLARSVNDSGYAYRWTMIAFAPLRDSDGSIREWIGAIVDISELWDQQERIRESEERFRALVGATSDTVWWRRADGSLIEMVPDITPLYPPPPGTDEAYGWLELIHPEERDEMKRVYHQYVKDGTPYDQIYRLRRVDGIYRWRHARGVALRNSDGSIRELVGTVLDITDWVEREQTVRESEVRYRTLVDSFRQGIWRADPYGNIYHWNAELESIYRHIIGHTDDSWSEDLATIAAWIERMHPEDRERVPALWQQCVATGEIFETEYRVASPEAPGSYYWFVSRAVPVRDDQGNIREWMGVTQDTTHKREAEMRLRESEARLKEAQSITHSGHFRYEFAGELSPTTRKGQKFWSDEMYRIFERDPADGPPSDVESARYYTPEDLERIREGREQAQQSGGLCMVELPITTERGNRKWIQLHLSVEYNAGAQIAAVYGAVVDITAFKTLEESWRQAQQMTRRISLAVPDLIYVYDIEGGQTHYTNRSMAQLLGFGPDDPELLPFPNVWAGIGDKVSAFLYSRLHPDDHPAYQVALQQLRVAADGEVVEVTVRLQHKEGHWRTFYCREIIFTRDETTGQPREVLGVAQDITERIEAENRQQESEEKYRSLVDILSDWVWECDENGQYTYVSDQVTRRLGYRPEEMIGLTFADFAPHEDRERLTALLQGASQRRQALSRLPMRAIGIAGDTIYLEISGVPLISSEGEFLGFRGVAYDVSARKMAEIQLRSSEERTRRIIESSPDCMMILDLSGRLISVNEAGRRLLAIADGERGIYWPAFWEGEWRQVAEDAVIHAVKGETRRFIGFTRAKQGEGRWWDIVITALPDARGRTEQLLVVSRDISTQKTLEQQKDQLLADAMQRAERDPLTGLYDHQAFHKRLQEEGLRADRECVPFAVAVLDVDNFKYFNDAFGHLEGDAVLLHITNALRSTCRPTDTIGRLGGDEFAVVLPGVLKQDAVRLLESRLQANAFASRWQPRGYDAPIPLRISFGVSVYPDEASTPLGALSLADERLYRNKKEGQAGLLEHLRVELTKTMVGFPMLDALVTAVDSKDRYTRKHSEDVLIYAVMIGQALGIPEDDLSLLRPAALLHDVGKIGVSQRILRLPTSLTQEEYEAIKQHAPLGAALVEVLLTNAQTTNAGDKSAQRVVESPLQTTGEVGAAIGLPAVENAWEEGQRSSPRLMPAEQLRKLVAAVRHHHEAMDGSGYPDGLKGEEIPLLARILAVADAFSALTTDRPYRRGANPEQAIAILKAGAGRQWDRDCIAAFIQVVETSRARALAALGAMADAAPEE